MLLRSRHLAQLRQSRRTLRGETLLPPAWTSASPAALARDRMAQRLAGSVGGTSRPSTFAVLRLIASSYLQWLRPGAGIRKPLARFPRRASSPLLHNFDFWGRQAFKGGEGTNDRLRV